MTEMIGHIAETAGHDEPKTRSVTMDRNPRSRCRNHRSRWSEIRNFTNRYLKIDSFYINDPGLQGIVNTLRQRVYSLGRGISPQIYE